MIGRLLDGRYQVRSRIARGGMATVYLATDLRLERRVAVKIMHGHLADDSKFKERFIQEARSSARLAHPNVVNVFDQGQDSDMAYLVMEYLSGITLRQLLDEHRVLTTEQTLDILEAVLGGLAAAHKAGIVHRDLKPENVLLADDGRIKISDFGLARAATANTATGAALLGTIAYLSPELVTRGVADTRSDIYAIGIMMYEMLVGEQPFKGEQPMQIAYQHANDSVPRPSAKNPKVPSELDEIVLWATDRNPENRPKDARALLDQLFEIHSSLLSSASTGSTSTQRTMLLPSATARVAASATAETQILGSRGRGGDIPTTTATTATGASTGDFGASLTSSSRGRGRGVLIAFIIAAIIGGAFAAWYFLAGPGASVGIPTSIAGMTVEEATTELESLGFSVSGELGQVASTSVGVDLVAETDPPLGSAAPTGTEVQLFVSIGPKLLVVPVFVGMTEDQATAEITAAPFTLIEVVKQFSGDVASGIVIDALGGDRNGTSLTGVTEYGELQPITLIVSAGPLPDVSGLSVADATARLQDAGLEAGAIFEIEFSDTVPQGSVLRAQAVEGASFVRAGDVVDLVTSLGVEQVEVPNVVGLSWSEAKQPLLDAGFELEYNLFADAAPALFTVTSLDPAEGTLAPRGSTLRVGFSA